MKKIVLYLIVLALCDSTLLLLTHSDLMPQWWMTSQLILSCALMGGIGGAIYCLRGVYLNACVRKEWNGVWYPWYLIRPAVSHLCGAISYVFLKAGLLILDASKTEQSTDIGFLALAFIAGLNVDKFIAKIEDIAQATWGIDKSRIAKGDKKERS